MRPIFVIPLVVAACAGAPPHPQLAAPAVVLPAVAKPTEPEVQRWSHEVIDAYDRGDVAAMTATLSPGFLHFEGAGLPTSRDADLAQLAGRKPGAPHVAKRTWSSEHVYVRGHDAVFVGEAAEHSGGNDSHGGNDYDGWYTIIWSREGDAWKVSLWSWQRGGTAAERDTWNEMFRRGIGFDKEPNRLLVESASRLKPGAALDVAMGQGRNALYLASLGWKVTGVDFSDEGVRIARDAAAARHLSLDAVNADIDKYDFGIAKWDLVTMIYATQNVKWVERAKPSLKPGGLLVLEDFHADTPTGDGFARGQLAALFKDGFDILRDEVVEGRPDWARDQGTIERFVARKR